MAEHYHKSPDRITEEELRLYFLYLKNDQHASPSAFSLALCGLKFLYERTLHREWATLDPSLRSGQALARPAREKKLPVVLRVAEVRRILGCLRRPHYRVCLTTIYSCGLRLRDGVYLQVRDIGFPFAPSNHCATAFAGQLAQSTVARHAKGAQGNVVPPERGRRIRERLSPAH